MKENGGQESWLNFKENWLRAAVLQEDWEFQHIWLSK